MPFSAQLLRIKHQKHILCATTVPTSLNGNVWPPRVEYIVCHEYHRADNSITTQSVHTLHFSLRNSEVYLWQHGFYYQTFSYRGVDAELSYYYDCLQHNARWSAVINTNTVYNFESSMFDLQLTNNLDHLLLQTVYNCRFKCTQRYSRGDDCTGSGAWRFEGYTAEESTKSRWHQFAGSQSTIDPAESSIRWGLGVNRSWWHRKRSWKVCVWIVCSEQMR